MIILPHLLIGAAIGLRVHNFGAVFVLALISHCIADRIPHWDYVKKNIEKMSKKEFFIFNLKIAADAGTGGLLLLLLLWQRGAWPYALFGAYFFADFFPGLNGLIPIKKSMTQII